MKQCILYAYDHQNLGDDLFVHVITKRYKNTTFYMWSDLKNKETFSSINNLKIIDEKKGIIKFLRKIRTSFVARYKDMLEKRCQAVVYIGGSIFIEYDNWEQLLTWWEYEALNRKFYVLGANFGPYHTPEYRNKLAQIFEKMQDICFRDYFSLKTFSDVRTVRYAPDILFDITIPKRKNTTKNIFVSVINCESKEEGTNQLSKYHKKYIQFMGELIKKFLEQGYSVTMSSFCKEEGDAEGIKCILDTIEINNERSRFYIDILEYDGTNSEEMLQAISDSDYVIASRFHAAILGFAAEKPVFPVLYSDKMINVLKDVNFEGKFCDLRKIEEIDFESLFTKSEMQKLHNIDIIKKQSRDHFRKLDLLLRG